MADGTRESVVESKWFQVEHHQVRHEKENATAFDLFVCFEFHLVTGDGGDAHDHLGMAR